MRLAKYLLNRQPLLSALIAIAVFFVTAGMLRWPLAGAVQPQATADHLAKLAAALLLALVLVRSGAYPGFGLAASMRRWRRGWWHPALVMVPCVLPSFLRDEIAWGALQFNSRHAFDWVVWFSSSGFSEETVFRGACFYILYRVWGTTRSGLQRAAVTCALVFGAMHLMSLGNRDLTYVLYQVCFASLIGYAFAGLSTYAGSLWPAIVLHASINALSGIDNYFAGPDYVFRADTHAVLIAIVATYFVFGAIPGYWCLRRAPLFGEAAHGELHSSGRGAAT